MPLTLLPLEVLTEIAKEVDWKTILTLRKTCRLLYQTSKIHTVWAHMYFQHLNASPATLRTEEPLDCYSAVELERYVLRRASADLAWKAEHPKPTRSCSIHHPWDRLCLVPGGRWLLTGSKTPSSVLVYDLDLPDPTPSILLEEAGLYEPQEVGNICVDLDDQAPTLTFNMALSPANHRDTATSVLQVHIWRVTLINHGRNARLAAHHVKSFEAQGFDRIVALALHGPLLARGIITGAALHRFTYYEVFDWTKSTSSLHRKRTIFTKESHTDQIQFLPGDRLVIMYLHALIIYDISTLEDTSDSGAQLMELDPTECLWRLPYGDRKLSTGKLSRPVSDAHATYFGFKWSSGGCTLSRVAIPHDVSQPPAFITLAVFRAETVYSITLGYEKGVISYQDRVCTVNFKWDGRCAIGIDMHDSSALEFPCNDLADFYLDEQSGRIIQDVGRGWVTVLDMAYV
ncbi:hypothetical protein Hypma_004715 [Hypsizygus marmoreus]|uniref:F-box domain-containing protein n=1 Tax=Hypsizygus marmoreus TaxID=39966 RepID=A0A369J2C5_HYPMA|nr:hypothetical protein Hypma_004715 [Hypsizygus marmoreus]